MFRLNFAQRPIFSGLRFRLGTPSLKSLPEDLCSGFLRPEKNPSTSAAFEPANLGSRGEHGTARPPRPTIIINTVVLANDPHLKTVVDSTIETLYKNNLDNGLSPRNDNTKTKGTRGMISHFISMNGTRANYNK